MKPLVVSILVLVIAVAALADETIYRYEGDIHPLDPAAGWEEFNPCDPPCSDFIEDGHFVRLWTVGDDFTNYHLQVAEPPDPPPPTLWVEGRYRSNFPLGPILIGCDGAFRVHYQSFTTIVYLYGDSVISGDWGSFVLDLDMSEFHTYRFESPDGQNYWWSVDGEKFYSRFVDTPPNGYHSIQMWGNGGCSIDWFPNMKNEWDFVRYGTIDSGERIVATDPPSGTVSSGVLSALDTFTVTFDSANYAYNDEITVTTTGGAAPTVVATRRREFDEPDTVEIVLDQPPPSGQITRFVFDDGEATNIVEFADFPIGQGACCLGDGSCQDLTEEACATLPGATFRGTGTACLGDNDGNSVDDACDDLGLCPTGANCGGPAGAPTQCSNQDTCDAQGTCQPNHLPAGTSCGAGDTECSNQDTCDAQGVCQPNDVMNGTPCGDPATECTDHDTCVGGICQIAPLFACGPTDGCCPPGCGPRDHDLDCGDPVPTVSAWGLVILALLLLTGIKIKLRVRQS